MEARDVYRPVLHAVLKGGGEKVEKPRRLFTLPPLE